MVEYVIETKSFSRPHYFCGWVEGEGMTDLIVIAASVFDAERWTTEADAEDVQKHLGKDWVVTEMIFSPGADL